MGHGTAGRIYKDVLPYLCIKAGVPLQKPKYRLIPDGTPYIDPVKDAIGSALAIAFGLADYEEVVGAKGGDYRETWRKIAAQKEEAKSLGLELAIPNQAQAIAVLSADNANNDTQKKPAK
jgi:capsid protein